MIQGTKRETTTSEFKKKVGIFEGKVVAVNPDAEWYANNGIELKEGSKATEYLGQSSSGNRTVRIDFWLKEVNTGQLFKAGYFLEEKIATTADGTKTWFINSKGNTSCATGEEDLKDWFTSSDYRIAYSGEKELYNFMKTWLRDLGPSKDTGDYSLSLDFKKLMNGNVREIEQQINGEYATNVVMAAVINTKEVDGVPKEYQKVFNKAVTADFNMKYFTNKTYSEEYLDKLREREAKKEKFKGYEKFIIEIVGAYGCKDFYSLKPLHDYNPAENIVAPKVEITSDGNDY